MSKTTETLIEDIYALVSTKDVDESVDVEAEIEKFGEAVKDLMRTEFGRNKREDKRTLRLSNIGRTDKYLWNHVHGTEKEEIQPHVFVKFMYGHVVEELLLFLTRMAGHEVTGEQKQCDVEGIKGHMDCIIDGVVTDVKSVSSYGFKKFKDSTLAYDDPFGYVAQIKGYAHAEGATKFGWLAMDKQNGHLTYLMYDSEDEFAPVYEKVSYDIEERIQYVKEMVQQEEPPEVCYEAVPDGKSGNMKLAVGCSYCQYKKQCWPDVRGFAYSTGPRYLVEVVNEPKVPEIELP